MRRAHEDHRKAHRRGNPTSCSTTNRRCSMKRLARTRISRVFRHAPNFCALHVSRFLLPPSQTTPFELFVLDTQVFGACCHVLALCGTVSVHLHTAPPYN